MIDYDLLEEILYRENSIINPDDVALLMRVIRLESENRILHLEAEHLRNKKGAES